MTQRMERRPSRSMLANGIVLLGLLALGAWMLGLQPKPWFAPVASGARWWWAGAAIAIYAGFVLWTSRRPATDTDDATDIARSGQPIILVAYASQTGFALQLAQRTVQTLRDAGCAAKLRDLGKLDAAALTQAASCLFIVSTTGEGDPPDHALAFVRDAMSARAPVQARCAVLALGDRTYANYCAFGHQLDAWLRQVGADAAFDLIEVDNGDEGALRRWQHQLGVLSGAPELPDWAPVAYQRWTLAQRRRLNAGSLGADVFHIALTPPAGQAPEWTAGDIAEIGPRHGAVEVSALLDALCLDGTAVVPYESGTIRLEDLLARSHLPEPAQGHATDAAGLAALLEPLPHREYSIASIPHDGAVHLLLRRMLRPDGTPGLGSAWLCDNAPLGGSIDLRIRSNPNFHPPTDARPLILVGNGTGIAGLRALLKARIAAGHHRNWLFFGERSRACDFHYGEDVQGWLAQGAIERLDLAFSRDRDDGARRYVQHAIRERAHELSAWLRQGASIYVCGSLQGMAPAVDAELVALVGRDALDRLIAEGRYRRDVY